MFFLFNYCILFYFALFAIFLLSIGFNAFFFDALNVLFNYFVLK